MAQSLNQMYLHLVFSTKKRIPWINPAVESHLYKYIKGICQNEKVLLNEINGMPDHIHILVSFSRTITVSDFMKKIKANTSRWLKAQGPSLRDFAWQSGFASFSIGVMGLDQAVHYIRNQKAHHRDKT